MASNAKNLGEYGGQPVYLMAKGVRVGAKGKVSKPSTVAAPLTKGERRKLRKSLDRAGRRDLSRESLNV